MSILKIIGLGFFVLVCYGIGQGTNFFALLATIGFFAGSIALYFCPAIVASSRNHTNKTSIVVLNLFLGWTVIGWVGALVWAYSSKAEVLAEITAMPLPSSHNAESSWVSAAEGRTAKEEALTKKCPFCAEDIKVEAIKCKHCGSEVSKITV